MTWEQVGPLVGVVIGALLGGFAQILNEALKARRQVRQQRIEATHSFLQAFGEATLAHQHTPHRLRGETTPPDPSKYVEADWRAVRADERLRTTAAYLALLDDRPQTTALMDELMAVVRDEVVGQRFSPWGDQARDRLGALIVHARS
jgi:hypothetical protein